GGVEGAVGRLDRLVVIAVNESAGRQAQQEGRQSLADSAGRTGRVVKRSARVSGSEGEAPAPLTVESHIVAVGADVRAELQIMVSNLFNEAGEGGVRVVIEHVVGLEGDGVLAADVYAREKLGRRRQLRCRRRWKAEAPDIEADPARIMASFIPQIAIPHVERQCRAEGINVVNGDLSRDPPEDIARGDVVPVIAIRTVIFAAR